MSRYTSIVRRISYVLIGISLIVLSRALPIGSGVTMLRQWVDGLGAWGPLAFGLIYVVAVVAMVPASLLTLAGGATFGLLVGTITVSLASNIGAALALLIARYLARAKVEQLAQQRPKFAAVDQAINEGGWKIVALLRLSPAIPFNVQNYLYGLTSIGFWTCVLTSWVAMLPGTFLYVYLGHAAGSVAGGTQGKSLVEWMFLVVGLLATVAVTVYITRLAQRKLREQVPTDTPVTGAPTGDSPSLSEPEPAPLPPARPLRTASTVLAAAIAVILAGIAGVSLANPVLLQETVRRLLPLGPPQVEMTEAYAQQTGGPTFDHSRFDHLLKRNVAAEGWVDYDGLQAEESELDAYLAAIAAAPFDDLARDEKLALLINAYNAFTLRLILDHWPLTSIKEIPTADRWAAVRWNVGGHVWSLEQIEHEQVRPNFREPRIHFALVCAAVGCPPLANEAYTADRLESQLQRQAEFVHAHPTWLQVDAASNTVSLTQLYTWYESDFLSNHPTTVAYAANYSAPLRELLAAGGSLRIASLPYDWTINDVHHRQSR